MDWIKRPLLEGTRPLGDEMWIPRSGHIHGQETPNATNITPVLYTISQGAPFHGYLQMVNIVGSYVEYYVVIPKTTGTVKLGIYYYKGANLGNFVVKVDGVTKLTLDSYKVAPYTTNNYAESNLGARTETKRSTIRIETTGKNASSSDFFVLPIATFWWIED